MSLINNKIQDPLLKQIEDGIASRLVPKTRKDYENVVIAGMKVGEKAGLEGLRPLTESDDPVKACAMAGANTALLLYKQTNGRMPTEVIPPASMTLMLQAMDFLDKAKIREASREDVAAGARIQMERIMSALGLTMPVFQKMAAKTNEIMNDPAQMEQLNRRAGTVRDPRASTPTEVPEPMPPVEGSGLINQARGAADGV